MIEETHIYCAYDTLNPTINPDGSEKHWCAHYGSYICKGCDHRFDGDRIKKYMEDHPKNINYYTTFGKK